MQRGKTNRREFLGKSVAAGAAAGAAMSAPGRARAAGANERIKLGLIGCGGRMAGLANYAKEADQNITVTAICDV